MKLAALIGGLAAGAALLVAATPPSTPVAATSAADARSSMRARNPRRDGRPGKRIDCSTWRSKTFGFLVSVKPLGTSWRTNRRVGVTRRLVTFSLVRFSCSTSAVATPRCRVISLWMRSSLPCSRSTTI